MQALRFVMDLPDEQSRAKLVRLYSRGLSVPQPIRDLIVRRTKGASTAFIKELMRRSAQLEETGQTIAIDVRKRAVVSTWRSCDSPSGVAVDSKRGFVFVACRDHVIVLDVAHNGRIAESIATGAGLDNIDYKEDSGLLYAAAGIAAQLTIALVNDEGKPVLLARVPTATGARSVVAGPDGIVYLIDPLRGRILKVESEREAKPSM
jgi:hypothetical protein